MNLGDKKKAQRVLVLDIENLEADKALLKKLRPKSPVFLRKWITEEREHREVIWALLGETDQETIEENRKVPAQMGASSSGGNIGNGDKTPEQLAAEEKAKKEAQKQADLAAKAEAATKELLTLDLANKKNRNRMLSIVATLNIKVPDKKTVTLVKALTNYRDKLNSDAPAGEEPKKKQTND